MYLLDTNILSDALRAPEGPVGRRIQELDDGALCTSVIVAAELRFGAMRKGSSRLSHQIDGMLQRIRVAAFDAPADAQYAALRVALESAGTPIGANDMLIAAHALALGCVLVTDNVRELSRVPSLTVENWLR